MPVHPLLQHEASAGSPALAAYPARLLDTPAGCLSIRSAGGRPSPTILLLHGIGSGSGSWVGQLAGLEDRFHLVAWDAPGYGDSPIGALPAQPDADDYATRVIALLDALSVDRCLLVGQSLGAIMAVRVACAAPERVSGLLLAAPARGYGNLPPAERTQRLQERVERFVRLGPAAHAAQRAPNLLSADPNPRDLDLAEATMTRISEAGYRRAAYLLAESDIMQDLHKLRRPVDVVVGSDDRITPPENCRTIAASVPGSASFTEIPDAGHAVYFARSTLNERIVRFAGGLAE